MCCVVVMQYSVSLGSEANSSGELMVENTTALGDRTQVLHT